MTFYAAFLNCRSFFKPKRHAARFSGDESAYRDKVRDLAAAIKSCRNGELPHIIGLCEIGGTEEAQDLLAAISPGFYSLEWQAPPFASPDNPEISLGIAYDAQTFAIERIAPGEVAIGLSRFHWYAIEFRIRATQRSFWVVVNHWPADSKGYIRNHWLRMQIGAVIGEFYKNTALTTTDAMLLMGDFNCEPFDDALTGDINEFKNQLVCVRERDRVLRDRLSRNYFYNPSWSLLGARHEPYGTYCRGRGTRAAEWRCFDQLLVNPRLLNDGPASLIQDSIRISMPSVGASDHGVVSAAFEYT